jgi:hypothetical protein
MIFILLLLSCGTSSKTNNKSSLNLNDNSLPTSINARFYLANSQKRILLPDGSHHWGDHIITGLECHNEPDSLTSLVLVPTLDGSLESIPLRERTHLYQFPVIDKDLPFPASTPACKMVGVGDGENHIQIPPSYQNKREKTFTDEFVFYLKITGFVSSIIKFVMSVIELKNNADILHSFFTDTIQGLHQDGEVIYFPSYQRITFEHGFNIFSYPDMEKLWKLYPTPREEFVDFMRRFVDDSSPGRTSLSVTMILSDFARSKKADNDTNVPYIDAEGDPLPPEKITSIRNQRKNYEEKVYLFRKHIFESHLKLKEGFKSNPKLFTEWLAGLNRYIEVDGLSRYKLGKAFFTMLPFVFFITLGSFLIFGLSLQDRDAMYKSSALYKKYTNAYKQAYIAVKKNPKLWKSYYDAIMKGDFITSSAIINPLVIIYFNHEPLFLDYSMHDYLNLLINKHPLIFRGTSKMDFDFVVDGIK